MSVSVIFAGPDDKETCDGCDEAVNGSPYDLDEDYPVPGEQECMSNCRHILQLDSDIGDGDLSYSDSTGFAEAALLGLAVDSAIDAGAEKVTLNDVVLGADVTAEEMATITDDLEALDDAELADALVSEGLTIDDAEELTDLTLDQERTDAVQMLMDNIESGVTTEEMVGSFIDSGDVENLTTAFNSTPEALDEGIRLGEEGFNDSASPDAFALAEALTNATDDTYVATLADDENRWYVGVDSNG